MQTHGPATDKTGFIYMLAGDTGASDTDPWATMKTAENLWVGTLAPSTSIDAGPSDPQSAGDFRGPDAFLLEP